MRGRCLRCGHGKPLRESGLCFTCHWHTVTRPARTQKVKAQRAIVENPEDEHEREHRARVEFAFEVLRASWRTADWERRANAAWALIEAALDLVE
jgi:hypothetical protein